MPKVCFHALSCPKKILLSHQFFYRKYGCDNMIRFCRVPWRNGTRTFHRTRKRYQSNQPPKEDPIDIPIQSSWYRRYNFFGWFHKTQQKHPLSVQLCTTTVVYFCGDLLAQDVGGEIYDGQRTVRMVTIGALASIPGYKW